MSGFWYLGHWYESHDVLPDDARAELPETVSHDEVDTHPILCACAPCARYPRALRVKLKRRARERARS